MSLRDRGIDLDDAVMKALTIADSAISDIVNGPGEVAKSESEPSLCRLTIAKMDAWLCVEVYKYATDFLEGRGLLEAYRARFGEPRDESKDADRLKNLVIGFVKDALSGPGEDVTVGTSRASLPSASPVPTPPEIPPYFPVEFAREMTKILAPSDKRNAPASLDDAHAHAIVKRAAVDVLLADQRLCANKAGLLRRYRHLQWFVSCVAAYRPGDAFPPRDDAGGSDDLAVTVRDAVEAFGAEAVASALGLANAERAELIVFRELRNEAVELCAKPEGFRDVHDEANVAYKLTLVGSADAPPAQRCNDNCPYKEALVAGFASIRLTVACEACGQTGLSPSGSNCPKCRGYGDLDENGNPFEDEEDGEDPE
jgi:hypothetical protein